MASFISWGNQFYTIIRTQLGYTLFDPNPTIAQDGIQI